MANREAAAEPTVPPLDPKYLEQISHGLDRAFEHADQETAEIDELRLAIFSDHHKGASAPSSSTAAPSPAAPTRSRPRSCPATSTPAVARSRTAT